MFTGIVEEVGTVQSLRAGRLTVSAAEVLKGTRPGDSIAVNGACLTVTVIGGNILSVDIMPETVRRTNLGTLLSGDEVNLERALAANGRFGGHFVQGHIDATGRVSSVVSEGEASLMEIAAPPEIMRYVVDKGYITVDGVSLTVIRCDDNFFTISLVGYTKENTTLGHKRSGDIVNLEVDIIAKYVEKIKGQNRREVSLEFLAEHGFLST